MNGVNIVNVIMLLGMVCTMGCTPHVEFEVATWSGFKHCAVTYTFDDSYDNQFKTALPLFYKYDYPCTFFLTTNNCNQEKWNLLREAVTKKIEVGCHTVNHAVYDTMSIIQQKQDILDCKAKINVNLPMSTCNTFAHTNCIVGDTSLLNKYFFACRGCQGYIETSSPKSYINVSSLSCGAVSSVNTLNDFKESLKAARNSHGWCIFTIFDLDDGNGYSPLKSSTLEQSLSLLRSMDNTNSFWVASFRDAAKYAIERDNVLVKIKCELRDKITAEITAGLDKKIFNYPLTIRCPLPYDWEEVEVLQKEIVVPFEVKTMNGCRYIVFSAVPDAGDIYLIRLN